MNTFARFVASVIAVSASLAHADELKFSEGAAAAYVDLMAFIVSETYGSDARLTPQQKTELVSDVRARWDKGNEGWKRRVLDSPRVFVQLLQAWRAADAAARQRQVAKWKRELQGSRSKADDRDKDSVRKSGEENLWRAMGQWQINECQQRAFAITSH